MPILDAQTFGVTPESDDNTLALQRALDACRALNGEPTTLQFAPGVYHFHPTFAGERLCWPSNNDGGVRRIAFPLIGFADLIINGGGAEFVFHGEIIPFALDGSRGVTLQNFAIDWHGPVTLTGEVISVTEGIVELALDPDGQFRVGADGSLTICGEGWETSLSGYIEIDPATKAPAYGTGDAWMGDKTTGWQFSFEAVGPHRLRFRHAKAVPTVGHHLVFLRGDRRNPGIFVSECADITLTDVAVYQATAMALIVQRTHNLTAERFRVELRPGTNRLVTASADATHFVGCRGTIRLIDCLFEGQLDDPANIHGTYTQIRAQLAPNELLLGRMHGQQKGVPFAEAGDRLTIYDPSTMDTITETVVAAVREINADVFAVTLADALPETAFVGMVVENMSWTPDVEIRGCNARRNRARGFLISTPGKVVIEGNTLSPGGAGILIPGECQYWFESGAVRDVTIRGNHFDHCNTGTWGIAAIDITPHIPQIDQRETPFHRNIRIEDNTFTTFQNALIAAWSVDGLTVRGNYVVKTTEHSPFGKQTEVIALRGCQNVDSDDAFVTGS